MRGRRSLTRPTHAHAAGPHPGTLTGPAVSSAAGAPLALWVLSRRSRRELAPVRPALDHVPELPHLGGLHLEGTGDLADRHEPRPAAAVLDIDLGRLTGRP